MSTPDIQAQDKRKRTYASNATIYAAFAIGALVSSTSSTRVFGRLDLTQNGIYTLSPASKELVAPARPADDQGLHLEGPAAPSS